MWPDVEEQVAVERAQIDQLFAAYQAVITKSSEEKPDFIEHKPFAERECQIMLVEPAGTINTGDTGGDLTAEDGVWI
ncbi:hypothetical protein ACFLXQ_07785 [Chloroflexota bacterium]